MSSQTIEIRTWQEFSRETIAINDLDPTYELIYSGRKELGEDWASQLCLHMLMFYDLGEAVKSGFVEHTHFWQYVCDNYHTNRRGPERRHFRGTAGLNSIADLQRAVPDPRTAFAVLCAPSVAGVAEKFGSIRGFGNYFIWKMCDYLDRVAGIPVDFSDSIRFMPSEPIKCAKTMWPHLSIAEVLGMVVKEISQYPAPPCRSRPCGVSEAETILCMLKAYFLKKSHIIGDDLEHHYKSLGDDPHGVVRFLPPRVDTSRWVRVCD